MISRLIVLQPLLSAACKTDDDCSLLGSCQNSVCLCDAGWTGPRCGQVDLLPARRTWGYQNDTMSSWCGSAVRDGDTYHYFGSAMSQNCSLPQFATNSMSVRATSKSPTGPFVFQEVVAPEFAHSTSIKKGVDGDFLLFTIGKDMHGEDVHKCYGQGPWPKSRGDKNGTQLGPHDYLRIGKAPSVDGPWEQRVIMHSEPENPTAWNCNKSNPSAIVLNNGSILMMYRGTSCAKDTDCRKGTKNTCEHQGIAFAENADAPFVDRQGRIEALDGNEDAFFWQSKRGFHALFHSKNACESYGQSKQCGSLAYSHDSWHWTLNDEPAFDGAITWEEEDGSHTDDVLESRQRPNILFDEDGVTPLMLINGVKAKDIFKEFSVFVPFNVPRNRHPTESVV